MAERPQGQLQELAEHGLAIVEQLRGNGEVMAGGAVWFCRLLVGDKQEIVAKHVFETEVFVDSGLPRARVNQRVSIQLRSSLPSDNLGYEETRSVYLIFKTVEKGVADLTVNGVTTRLPENTGDESEDDDEVYDLRFSVDGRVRFGPNDFFLTKIVYEPHKEKDQRTKRIDLSSGQWGAGEETDMVSGVGKLLDDVERLLAGRQGE